VAATNQEVSELNMNNEGDDNMTESKVIEEPRSQAVTENEDAVADTPIKRMATMK